MKSNIAITLIIMGALLIMTPAISDYLLNRELTKSMISAFDNGIESVNMNGRLSYYDRLWCWMPGCIMIIVAIISSIVSGTASRLKE
ncbi:MAG: hypothetical protein HRU15_07370 [Planctomycetes bacterium]|nr:hypothetical protein [Planctomycetota bacterium]